MPVPVFDGHNDFLLRLMREPQNRETIWLKGDGNGHLDLPRMEKSGFAGGFFAIYIPSAYPEDAPDPDLLMDSPPYDLPLPDLISHKEAQPFALAMAGHLHWMERASCGAFRICRSVSEIRRAMEEDVVAAIMHMEGAEPIDPDLDALYLFYEMGLRSIGPVWSRPTVFGHGVPFRFPGDPDTGPGLTDHGKALIRECNKLNIMVDLSHMNEKGFNDVAAISNAPLVATHSNVHALTPSPRNLTNRQLDMIRESKGLVGLNYATIFLREDGRKSAEMELEPVIAHLSYLVEKLGENHVGLGSDFDGATLPAPLGDVCGNTVLLEEMRKHQFGEELIEKIAHGNWLSLLEKTWGA